MERLVGGYSPSRRGPLYLGPHALLTSLGDLEETFEALRGGKSGLRRPSGQGFAYGRIEEFPQREGAHNRLLHIASGCLQNLEARLGHPLSYWGDSLRFILSTTKGNVAHLVADALEEGQPPHPDLYLWDMAQRLAERFKFSAPPLVVSNACISGVSALRVARYLVEVEGAKHVLLLGADEVSAFLLHGFASLQCLSVEGCSPYSEPSEGMSLGDGCAAVLLTTDSLLAQGVDGRLVEVAGVVITNDAEHLSSPSESGDQLVVAIRGALSEARITPAEIAFVNGHGTGTLYNDSMELRALRNAGLDSVPLNGLKGAIGHSLGASGVIELLLCAEELRRGYALGTVGLKNAMEAAAGRVLRMGSAVSGHCCLKLGSGFGGCNAAVVLRLLNHSVELAVDTPGVESTHGGRSARCVASWARDGSADDGALQNLRRLFPPAVSAARFARMGRHAQWCSVAVAALLAECGGLGGVLPSRVGVVFHSRSASLSVDAEHGRRVKAGAVSPALFPYTLGNAAISEVCIAHGFKGETLYLSTPSRSDAVVGYARWLVASGRCDAVVCGWVEEYAGDYDMELKLYSAE